MRQRDAFVALRLGDHFVGGGLGSFPLVKFKAVLDHFPLACEAAAFVLFVGFLEAIKSEVCPMLGNFLQGFFVRFPGFFACGALWRNLCEQGRDRKESTIQGAGNSA